MKKNSDHYILNSSQPADNNENQKKGGMERDPRKLLSNCDVIIEKSFLSVFKGCLLLIK